ncbi:uncharacterized protein LOC124264681 [Haliotis rubra]|uniref:uncharacterized protein LOC124264681 n=1 Tax=Haliotis rubra TaxID=36100 RepID=UPI001EE50AC9|nr:uncharacterized protein LOC124264681 [Haliotis rubra]
MSSRAFKRENKIRKSTYKRFGSDLTDKCVDLQETAVSDRGESVTRTDGLQTEPQFSCITGRRIVEFDTLCKGLYCSECSSHLLLQNIQSETRIGLASLLYIKCECVFLNSAPNGKSHKNAATGNRGVPIYDVNTKAAAVCNTMTMLHSGLGQTCVSNWLAAMNIPPLSDRTLKRREREMGPLIEEVARNSCQLGHGCLIGQNKGNVVSYGSQKNTCRISENGSKNNITVPKHDCRYNWSGSAKSMESSLGVELLQQSSTDESNIKYIIMDDDTTTLSHIRKNYDVEIVKWSDINHSKKSLNNHLYRLSKT